MRRITQTKRAPSWTIGALAVGVVLAGCQGQSEAGETDGSTSATGSSSTEATNPQPTSSGEAPTASETGGSETESGPPADCGSQDAVEQAQLAAEQIPPPDVPDATWDPSGANFDGYDGCASLAWIVLPIQGGTASSPYAIAMFHYGEFIGRATEKSYGFYPEATRVDDATASVTYTYPLDGEANADASGTAIAQFHYDEASGTVQMSGEVPPA